MVVLRAFGLPLAFFYHELGLEISPVRKSGYPQHNRQETRTRYTPFHNGFQLRGFEILSRVLGTLCSVTD